MDSLQDRPILLIQGWDRAEFPGTRVLTNMTTQRLATILEEVLSGCWVELKSDWIDKQRNAK